jgi:hypothetical protein
VHLSKPVTELIRERVSTRRYVPVPIDDERRRSDSVGKSTGKPSHGRKAGEPDPGTLVTDQLGAGRMNFPTESGRHPELVVTAAKAARLLM